MPSFGLTVQKYQLSIFLTRSNADLVISDDTRVFSLEVVEEVLFDCFNLVGERQVFEITSGLSASYVKASVHQGLTKTCAEATCPAGEVVDEVSHFSYQD